MSVVNDYVADPRRVLLGAFAAPLIASLATEVPTFRLTHYWGICFLGFMSVISLYLPIILWRLPRTRRPFLTCVAIGAISAPGILGYAIAIIGGLLVWPLGALIVVATFPLGAIGGAVFWVCAVWLADGWEGPEEPTASLSDV